MKNVILGWYLVEGGERVMVETELCGHGPTDYAKLDGEVARLCPGRKFQRTSSRIEQRDENDPGFIEFTTGQTLKELFGDDAVQLRVGTVTWNGTPCDVLLRLHRSKGVVGLGLRAGGEPMAIFSEQAKADRPVGDLPSLVRTILGEDSASNLTLRLREKSL